jgi:hypothetical protein
MSEKTGQRGRPRVHADEAVSLRLGGGYYKALAKRAAGQRRTIRQQLEWELDEMHAPVLDPREGGAA